MRHGYVVALDLDGLVVESLQYAGDDAYAPVTTVRQIGDWLYLGSLDQPAIARVRLRP